VREGKGIRFFDVDELLKNLMLHGEELNKVVLGKEEFRRWPEVKWLTAGKMLTRKTFSILSLKNTMMSAWSPTHKVFHEVELHLFRAIGILLRGVEKDNGGWTMAILWVCFDDWTHLCSHDGALGYSEWSSNSWVQINKLSPPLCNVEVLAQLANRVG
jgi:hypothetical protein